MNVVLGSLIAVAGTLLGSLSTHLFQQRATRRAEAAAREERMWRERLVACGEFATAATDLKRAVVAAWLRRGGEVAEHHAALAEADLLGAVAESARFRMLLVTDDPELRERAEVVLGHMGSLRDAADRAELQDREARFEADVSAFIAAAARLLR
ncbi:hypothetical protein ACSNOI_34555 [Actinomadura kijaniata]|uniref:hypothetical protein n=1 Tax=Actinomadura kijaniata TaxID=46161 RepID=UPI003F1C89DB